MLVVYKTKYLKLLFGNNICKQKSNFNNFVLDDIMTTFVKDMRLNRLKSFHNVSSPNQNL